MNGIDLGIVSKILSSCMSLLSKLSMTVENDATSGTKKKVPHEHMRVLSGVNGLILMMFFYICISLPISFM